MSNKVNKCKTNSGTEGTVNYVGVSSARCEVYLVCVHVCCKGVLIQVYLRTPMMFSRLVRRIYVSFIIITVIFEKFIEILFIICVRNVFVLGFRVYFIFSKFLNGSLDGVLELSVVGMEGISGILWAECCEHFISEVFQFVII